MTGGITLEFTYLNIFIHNNYSLHVFSVLKRFEGHLMLQKDFNIMIYLDFVLICHYHRNIYIESDQGPELQCLLKVKQNLS